MGEEGDHPRLAGIWGIDDDEADAWAEEWAAVDREAAEFLSDRLAVLDVRLPGPDRDRAAARLRAELGRRSPEAAYLRTANGWGDALPPSDAMLWLAGMASTISPPDDPGTPSEEQASVMALQHADWLGLTLGLVRRGVGAVLDAGAAQRDIDDLVDVEGEIEDREGHLAVLEGAVEVLAPLWECLGALDQDRRLTRLGRWGLPAALRQVWEPLPREPRANRLAPETRDAALALLAERPRSLDDLRHALARQGTIVPADDLQRDLVTDRDVWVFDDETLGHVPTLARDLVLTHEVGTAELERGMLELGTDLDAWLMLADDGLPWSEGGTVGVRYGDHGYDVPGDAPVALEGPDGWLDRFTSGDLVALRYVDGALRLEPADPEQFEDVAAHGEELAALARVIEAAVAFDAEHGDPTAPGVSGAEIVYRLRRDHPEALQRPVRPLGAFAEALGYDLQHGYVCRPGARWEDPPSRGSPRSRRRYGTSGRPRQVDGDRSTRLRRPPSWSPWRVVSSEPSLFPSSRLR